MRQLFLLLFVALNPIFSLPVTKTTKKPEVETPEFQHNLEYERYLKEVVTALESDPEFRQKLNEASEDDIKTANIAYQLEYVNHQIRTRLDEIKREEMERLRSLTKAKNNLDNGYGSNHLKISQVAHVDHENAHTFEIEDLRRLILKTSEDLNAADKARREEFKQYELEKEFEKQEKLRGYEDDSRPEHEAELKRMEERHNNHPRVHHPGNKQQLEEVWEEQDHMKGVDFDPQTFFMMHDLDSNGVWDQYEVKALFVKELDKVYQQGLPEDDMRERAEEMERMREHVFSETDKNKDGLIDYKEFMDQTHRDDFQKDPEWETVDTEKVFTHDEYLEFEKRRQEEIQRMMAEHPEKFKNQVPPKQYKRPTDQQHMRQEQQYQNQQGQYNQQQQHQYNKQQHQQQQYNNQQQQQQQYNNQQHQQQQYNNHQQQQQQHNNDQQQVNSNAQPQHGQPAHHEQQQQQVPAQQKPIAQSADSNQIDSNRVDPKIQNSVEHNQPHVVQPQH